MRCLRCLCVLLLASAPAVSFAGDIQVTCELSLHVFLDGRFAGFSNAKNDGFFLANVPEGPHVIRVEKHGFAPQTFQVEILQLPIEVKVKVFAPEVPARPHEETAGVKVQQPVGNLQVTSAPQDCVVAIDGKAQPRNTPVLLIEGLAAGEHPISFSKPGYEPISGVVRIQPGVEVIVRGDLMAEWRRRRHDEESRQGPTVVTHQDPSARREAVSG